jgi:hypothetical protein
MDDGELHVLKYDCLHGSKEAVEKAFQHIRRLRDLVGNLAEGLDCDLLKEEVDQVMGLEGPEITV